MKKKATKKTIKAKPGQPRAQCGLCGRTTNLTKTECCSQWICDDEHKYKLFSYAHNSCHRNHRRYTLCGYHHMEDHPGDWKTCQKCKKDFESETEMYVHYGTNEYNFETLDNPPDYEPTQCSKCGKVIVLGDGGYSQRGDEYWCAKCTSAEFPDAF